MKPGDLKYCTFGPGGLCVIIRRSRDTMGQWLIFYLGREHWMREQHLVAV
jgi:hypothetical protein